MIRRKIEVPLYIINGFLESGKTSFIIDTIAADYFQYDGKTLILSCEQGEVEYDEQLLDKHNTIVEYVTREQIEDIKYLEELIARLNVQRVVLEFNGMWADILPISFPKNWYNNQQITIVDGYTFGTYLRNNELKSYFVNMVKDSELIIFNRCIDDERLKDYLRSIKAVNSGVEVLFEDNSGFPITVRLDEDLPYDINDERIDLPDEAYGLWFIDIMERAEIYEGKTIHLKASVLRAKKMPENLFIFGRRAVTCCADDIQFLGYACFYDSAQLSVKNGDWVDIIGTIKLEDFKPYGGVGPVLYATQIKKASKPKEELVYFVR